MHQYTHEAITDLLVDLEIDHACDDDQTLTLILPHRPEDIALEIDPDDGLYRLPRSILTYVCPDADV